jgi:hypothetical protein
MARSRISLLEVTEPLMELPAVREFERFVSSTGEIPPERARPITKLLVLRLLSKIQERYARVVATEVDAVLGLREEMTGMYRQALAASRGTGATPIELARYTRMIDALIDHIDRIATAPEWLGRQPADEFAGIRPEAGNMWDETVNGMVGGDSEPIPADAPEPSAPPEEPPSRHFDELPRPRPTRRDRNSADAAYDRELSRILRELDPARGNLSEQRALVQEFADVIHDRYLRVAGIPRLRVERQPASGAHMAAEIALGDLDPARDLSYEIVVPLPADLQLGGQATMKPDGWSFTGDTFELLEWKEPESQQRAAGYYAGPEGQLQLLADLELRGRFAERVPACRGWRYGANAGWLSDTLGWALKRLQGLEAGDPPVGASEAFQTAVNQAAVDHPTWATKIRVAP